VLIIPSSWGSQLVGDLYINTGAINLLLGFPTGRSSIKLLHQHRTTKEHVYSMKAQRPKEQKPKVLAQEESER
jgi:hypothetical protein